MRLLTKTEACRELRLSLSTLNRRIAAGEVAVRREPRGQRHRVYVMLDDDPPRQVEDADSALAVAQERIAGQEKQMASLREQVGQERQSNCELVNQPTVAQTSGPIDRRGFRCRLNGKRRSCFGTKPKWDVHFGVLKIEARTYRLAIHAGSSLDSRDE